MPKSQVITPQAITAIIAAANASKAASLSPPKFAIVKIVFATAAPMVVTASKPIKLHIAAMIIAAPGDILRVPTTVAIALGASVAPLTTVAPSVSSNTTIKTGLPVNAVKKAPNSITLCVLYAVLLPVRQIFHKA